MTRIAVRTISASDHLTFVRDQPSVSFLQTPAWGEVKGEWRSESIGWFQGSELVGAGLVLYRQLPTVRKYLAYLPEGPTLDWAGPEVGRCLSAMAAHVRAQGAFGVRIGPPVPVRSWEAATIKAAIADSSAARLDDAPADHNHSDGESLVHILKGAGWRRQEAETGFSAGQPSVVFQLPLSGRSADDVLSGMNQLWRRNIKKAAKVGVTVTVADPQHLPEFHGLYVETATRDGFTPRPLAYFDQMFAALLAEDPGRIRLYLAHHEGDLVAAATWVKVGMHSWYSYGASSSRKRDVRGSNAIQWQMIQDAIRSGAEVYDLRGITNTLASDDHHIGLIQFKVGTGGRAVEYVGEWDLPLNRLLYKAFDLYMSRR